MKKITAILPLLFALNANAQLLETNWSASELNCSCGYVIKGDSRTQSYLGCCTMAAAQVAYYYKKCNVLQGTNYIELRNFNDYDWTYLDASSYVEDGYLYMSYDTSVDFDFHRS